MGYGAAIAILIIDYLLAYGILGIGGIFRNRVKNQTVALVLGVVLALSLRYLCHIVSGFIFYGSWAEWFFTQESFYAVGPWLVERVGGLWLSLFYSIFYNGLYMIPEIIVTALCAVPVSRIGYVRKSA
jgi:thiamine transporter